MLLLVVVLLCILLALTGTSESSEAINSRLVDSSSRESAMLWVQNEGSVVADLQSAVEHGDHNVSGQRLGSWMLPSALDVTAVVSLVALSNNTGVVRLCLPYVC